MWHKIADFILRFRIALLVGLVVLTGFMGWQGRKAEILQEFVKVIPADDPEFQQYLKFKQTFGEDGNAVIVGLESDNFFRPEVLNALYAVSREIQKLEGVERVLGLTTVFSLEKDTTARRLRIVDVMNRPVQTQAEADSIRRAILNLPFYNGLLLTKNQRASMMIVSLDAHILVTKEKHALIDRIEYLVDSTVTPLGIKAHYSGVPFIRNYVSQKLPKELQLFMLLAVIVTAAALYAFYRSGYAVIFPLILLALSTVCTFGLVGLLGYKLSAITALIPPIIVILGIPPSIYMLSDYHAEFVKTGDKIKAIRQMIHKLGLVTLMINANTAFGFLTLYFTNVQPLREFGMLAFLATCLTYVLTIILIPGVFSLLPPPNEKRLKHLDSPLITRVVRQIDVIVQRRKQLIYGITFGLTVISVWGLTRIQAVSYMVDDLPDSDAIYTDLAFMENNFDAVMPFEIQVDTRKKNGVYRPGVLKKLDEAQRRLEKYNEISRTLSLADAIKWTRQAFWDGDSSQYAMPNQDEFLGLRSYLKGSEGQLSKRPILSALVDSTGQYARITGFVKDVGSVRMPTLLDSVRADLDQVFYPDGVDANDPNRVEFVVTGTTKIFLKANDYLIDNLVWSLVATFIIVGVQMFLLFGSFRIMLISMVPNIIPLAMTAAIMGFLDIELKPSTALIYGIAFGIAIDNSIHYLTAYRHARKTGQNVSGSISMSLRETGMSVIYTSVVLFVGFVIFTPSAFGSTRALGILTSVTMFIALFSNLLLLPLLLKSFDQEGPPSMHRLLHKLGIRPLIDEEDSDSTADVPTETEAAEGAYVRPHSDPK